MTCVFCHEYFAIPSTIQFVCESCTDYIYPKPTGEQLKIVEGILAEMHKDVASRTDPRLRDEQ